MEGTVFAPALEGMKHVRSENGEMLTQPFLEVCKLILPVIDKFGAAMTIVKSDIGGNISVIVEKHEKERRNKFVKLKSKEILRPPSSKYTYSLILLVLLFLISIISTIYLQRLESKYLSDSTKFMNLYNIVHSEIETKTAKASSSCTNGLLWLTRAMDFLVMLFRNLVEHPDWTMSQACTDSYSSTLKKWHGWLASSSFSLAMKLAPDRKKFMEVIAGSGDIASDMEKFCTTFFPLLEENHKFLASVGMDDMKAS